MGPDGTTGAQPDHGAPMDPVADLLRRQGGIARRRDLLRCGLRRRALEGKVARGELRALTPHLFTDVATPAPDEDLKGLVVSLDAVVSHTAAALLWGMELVETPCLRTVTVARDRSRAARDGARVSRADLPAADVVARDGVRVTSVVRTVLDLARSLPLEQAVAAADSALRRALVTVAELQAALRVLPAGRGRERVARVVGLVDARCGSVLESLFRVLIARHGLPAPVAQVVVRTRSGARVGRVDFAWPDLRLVVETDGFAFHADRERYRSDRRRGNALVLAGWRVLRFSWEDVVQHPAYVVASVRGLLEQAG